MSPALANPTDSKRRKASEARRRAILDAGHDLFVADGFAATRLDDVATRAGVAKGTIYLFFKDKQDLFEQVVLDAIGPTLDRLAGVAAQTDFPFDRLLTALFETFQREILGTRRREIIRLVIAEGPKFPRIAAFYHRNIVSRGLALVSSAARRAYSRGEIKTDSLVYHPHLIFGPMLISVVWRGLFEEFEPLDVAGLLTAHRDLLIGTPQATGQTS